MMIFKVHLVFETSRIFSGFLPFIFFKVINSFKRVTVFFI
ncbi:hypothetical protein P689_11961 [Candidatus Riesia pediculischaeffi PTSU]|uniref:Uncharacterized protein n=1 Tax=Candidatus Riesia pediculischaeffi PTSU TaxID=1401651 RepID=A0A0C1VJQ3_9ENTR|nr:hypothetical protein P689_11961 [Candidatus Riesia pediculischaeffi PTSU]